MFFQNYFLKIKELFSQKKVIIPVLISSLAVLIPVLILFLSSILNPSLNIKNLSDYSKVAPDDQTNYFVLQKDSGYLYKSSKEGINAVRDFIDKNAPFNKIKLLPEDFNKNSDLTRSEKDSEDPFLKNKNINISNEHYFFEQKINEIPIYGAQLAVHLRNKNEIYSVSGNLVNTKTTTVQKITEDQARQIALNDVQKEVPGATQFKIIKGQRYILNKKVLGISDDETNHLALGMQIDSSDNQPTFSMMYFIDLEKGEILYKLSNIMDVLNRQAYDCSGGSCILVRPEGSPPTGDSDVDNAYDFLGDTYNFYFNSFGRDSYNNQGAVLKGKMHYPMSCPNASWVGQSSEMRFCTNMVIKDITAHELTHAVTQYTAGLQYNAQSGALNESISDIFGSDLDNNWTMGEGSAIGIIRYMNNPPLKNQPDRLFSSLYSCSGLSSGCAKANDWCGVHRNSGIMNKAFYLMTDGDNFNGCSVVGVGRDKSSAVVYQALTRYLTSTSNFKSMYNSMLQACNDLYSSGSSDCETVKSALQATEMDQQPDSTQTGAYCQNIPRQTPICAGGSPIPTGSITPTVTLPPGISPTPISPTPTVTKAPIRFNISVQVWTDVNNSGNVFDNGDIPYQGATVTLTGLINSSGVTNSSGTLVFPNLLPGTYIIRITNITGFTINPITITITNFDVPVILPLPPIPSTTPPVIVTQPVIPTPTPTPIPTNTPIPTGGPVGGLSPTPTPTPIVTFNCVIDPKCSSGQKNLQFCPLICTPK
ncbi:MAG: M4 family metallopeptidase [Candidatus Levybacteria bacterium]|nr:M4 family metallopeptidase [Candidatus Levybacteria bacterium]